MEIVAANMEIAVGHTHIAAAQTAIQCMEAVLMLPTQFVLPEHCQQARTRSLHRCRRILSRQMVLVASTATIPAREAFSGTVVLAMDIVVPRRLTAVRDVSPITAHVGQLRIQDVSRRQAAIPTQPRALLELPARRLR